jgi:cytochrome bd ubiquinol oxidase subunit I
LLLWCLFLSFPLPWIAILTGWFTAEVGRQPWTVYGVLRTADAMTPFLTAHETSISLAVFCFLYSVIFAFGVFYIYQLLRAGPIERLVKAPVGATPNRPLSVVDEHAQAGLPLAAATSNRPLSVSDERARAVKQGRTQWSVPIHAQAGD